MKTNRVADPKWKLTLVSLLSVFCISWGCTTTQVVCPVGQPCDSYTEAHILASARSLHTGNLRGTTEILSPWLQRVGKPSLEEAAEQVKERRDPRNSGGISELLLDGRNCSFSQAKALTQAWMQLVLALPEHATPMLTLSTIERAEGTLQVSCALGDTAGLILEYTTKDGSLSEEYLDTLTSLGWSTAESGAGNRWNSTPVPSSLQ